MPQHGFGMGYPFGSQVIGKGGAECLLVFSGKMEFTDEKLFGEFFQSDLFRIMFIQIRMYLVQLFGDGIFPLILCLAFGKTEGDDIGNKLIGYQFHQRGFIQLSLIKLGKGIGKNYKIPWPKQEGIALLDKSIIVGFGRNSIEVDPHQTPGIVGAAFMGIRAGTIQPDTIADRYGVILIFIGYGTAAIQYDKEQVGIQILALADVRFQTL